MELGDYLHGVALLGMWWVDLALHFSKFLGEQIALSRSDLRVVSLQLHLVDGGDIALRRVETVVVVWHAHLLVGPDWAPVVRCSRFRE